ncbi:MAG TPA: 3-isopropylmalate dehydratase small subunit [Stellaceae bacterium]|nr:3-isopropylmalate dehydratase small subunit [Stellaceae bacterium]
MEKFARIDAPALPLPTVNVDTDQIVPARFLRKPRHQGYGGFLFHDLRFAKDGAENPDFVLNRPAYRGARVLVGERNFGCGSSREHAVYALWDYGFRAVIAPSFGDIFFGNCFKNGLLPIVLPAEDVAALRADIERQPGSHMIVDLAAQRVTAPSGKTLAFDIDAFRKHCLLQGVDEIDFTLGYAEDIAKFERRQAAEIGWL